VGLLRTVVLVAAILALLKGVACLAAPRAMRKTVDWWLRIPADAARAVGVVLIVGGCVLIGLAVLQMRNAVVAAVTVLGTAWFLAGLAYLRPPVLQAIAKPCGTAGPVWSIRVVGAVALIFAFVLLVIHGHGH